MSNWIGDQAFIMCDPMLCNKWSNDLLSFKIMDSLKSWQETQLLGQAQESGNIYHPIYSNDYFKLVVSVHI